MKFEYLNQLIAEKQSRTAEHELMIRREASALEDVQALKAEYERVIRESLAVGKDSTKDLDAITDKLETAQRAYDRRHQERLLYSSVKPAKITGQDVVTEWNTVFAPQFREQRFGPVMERLLAAKREIVDAVMDYHAAVREFNDQRTLTRGEVSQSHYYELKDADPILMQTDTEKYFVTDMDLRYLAAGEWPQSLPREVK